MKRIPLLLVALVACIAVPAQSIQVGPRLGVNFTNITIDGIKEQSHTRLHLGAFLSAPVADKFDVQVELLYSQQGAYLIEVINGLNTMNYLNIPLLGKFRPIEKLSVYGGPQIGIALSSKWTSKFSGDVYDFSASQSATDLSLLLGGEYEVYEGLTAGARYFFSLGDTRKEKDVAGKNKVFQISLAYDIARFLFAKE